MSGQMNKWKEEQILIICPGSQTTMAQLGCSELTPPAFRIPTRMFRDEETGEWRPYRTFKRKKQQQAAVATNGDAGADGAAREDEWEYVEDPESNEGAVYPLEAGHIVNMDAFLAFLEHVHGLLTTTYHNTPIVLMTSSQWTRPDCEAIALYIFEKTRTPALCMINSALATQYGLKWPHMTVIDIGFEKVDVTCIYDSRIVNHLDVGYASEPGDDRAISGGEVFTQRLRKLLRDKEFTYEMAEQLKKSNLCEVLPYAPEFPQLMELPEDDASAAGAAAGAASTNSAAAAIAAASGNDDQSAAGPVVASSATAATVVDDGIDEEDSALPVAEDGVLDVASIVTSGQTKEFLAKKDKERSERGRFGRRGKDKEAEAAAARPVRLPNAKRARMTFHFEELVKDEDVEVEVPEPATSNGSRTNGTTGVNGKSHGEEGEGSEDGSEGEDEEMEEDEEEEGGDDAEGESKQEKPEKLSTTEPTAAAAADAEKPKEESAAAESTNVKAEETPSVAPAAPETDKAEPAGKPAEEKPTEEAASAAEKPKEPEAPATTDDAAPAALASEPAPATTSEDKDKPASPKPAAEDATMEDAPSTAKEEATDAAKAADDAAPVAEAPAASSSTELVLAGPSAVAAPVEAPVSVVEGAKGPRYKRLRRDFEIGLERFTFADRYEIDRIVTTIYRAVQGIEEMYMRPACWENLVFVGNGCRLRGLRDNILQTLTARHLISPSSATMFTSELPSNMGTPSGTGSQTPTGNFNTPPHLLPTSSSVNPLLQAATTASLTGVPPPGSVTGGPGSVAGGDGHSHHFHSQTPTTIKLATLPTYLGEWTKNGFEEAMFLGAQVAARLAFCVHNLDVAGLEAQRQMSLTRVDYNELGPKGIRTHAMLG
ncbi:Actin-like protein arp9 [Sporothrix curviconia]|uniref:Actin-like protein arp9 n=1 Tax=Sporothrix curviconia TaxID=1260050 RepID=A0ABP0C607_9PEZI